MTQKEYGLELFKGLSPKVNNFSIKYYSRPWNRQLVYHWDKKSVNLTYWHRIRRMGWNIKEKISLEWPNSLCDPETHNNLIRLIENFKHDHAKTS